MAQSFRLVIISLVTLCCKSQIITKSAILNVSDTNDNFAQVNTSDIGNSVARFGWTVNVPDNQGWHWWLNFHNNKWRY